MTCGFVKFVMYDIGFLLSVGCQQNKPAGFWLAVTR